MLNQIERDKLRKTILELINRGFVHQTEIEKRACASSLSFATSNTVRSQLYGYLLSCGYVERVARGTYALTEKGEKLLALLT